MCQSVSSLSRGSPLSHSGTNLLSPSPLFPSPLPHPLSPVCVCYPLPGIHGHQANGLQGKYKATQHIYLMGTTMRQAPLLGSPWEIVSFKSLDSNIFFFQVKLLLSSH